MRDRDRAMLDGRMGMQLSASLREGSDQGNHWRGLQQVIFNPRSGAARHIALHELLGTQYAAKKTAVNYSKLLKISVKSHRFYWLDLYKTGKTARKRNSYNSEVDTGDWLCYSITNKSSRKSEGSEQNVHRKRTNVGSNVYEHAVLCSDAA